MTSNVALFPLEYTGELTTAYSCAGKPIGNAAIVGFWSDVLENRYIPPWLGSHSHPVTPIAIGKVHSSLGGITH